MQVDREKATAASGLVGRKATEMERKSWQVGANSGPKDNLQTVGSSPFALVRSSFVLLL